MQGQTVEAEKRVVVEMKVQHRGARDKEESRVYQPTMPGGGRGSCGRKEN